jgi:hypothetical protein
VRDALPDSFRDTFVERVRLRAFSPLTVDEDAEERAGWCSIENPLDYELDHNKLYFNTYLNVGFRIDRWQIPAPLFKAHLAVEEQKALKKRGRTKLGKQEKEDLRTAVQRRLRREVLPVMKVIDVSWNLDSRVVRLWNQSPRVHETFSELFEKTFSLALMSESPVAAAMVLGFGDADGSRLEALNPTAFHTSPMGATAWTSHA